MQIYTFYYIYDVILHIHVQNELLFKSKKKYTT